MKLNPIGSNQTELTTSDYIVLFSYQTPVAYVDKRTNKTYRTAEKFSCTTSKHINAWVRGRGTCDEVPHSVLEGLVEG